LKGDFQSKKMASFMLKPAICGANLKAWLAWLISRNALVFTVEFPTETTLQMLQQISGLRGRMGFWSLHALLLLFL
jgi:hypothetical protein